SLAPVLADTFRKEGHKADVIICPEKQFKTKAEEKTYKIPRVNSGGYDLLIELHLNASDGQGKGSEVLYYSNKGLEYATRICNKLGTVFKNRGAKLDKRLYILNSSKPTAVLIESFFCDNKEDYDKAKKLGHEGIAKLIVEGVLNKNINNEGVKQMYKHTIVYDGEVDKILANVLSWGYSPSKVLVCDIKDYVPGQTENLYVVGGGACEKISSITKEKFIMIKGNDRFDTLYKALDFINR
ncbi:N-acetylmuramoyl-L-alanine amidase family protein, partial [Clostridioides difficile Y215]|uniref:N-acetylmuramoyl-L-alanine amidase n=1 Tax=Clostridioides difficile TaxID=1496 RepID=UPI00038D1A0A